MSCYKIICLELCGFVGGNFAVQHLAVQGELRGGISHGVQRCLQVPFWHFCLIQRKVSCWTDLGWIGQLRVPVWSGTTFGEDLRWGREGTLSQLQVQDSQVFGMTTWDGWRNWAIIKIPQEFFLLTFCLKC